MKKFNEVLDENIKKLDLYVPVVARVHGKEHPEFHEVKRIFDQMREKIEVEEREKLELKDEFEELRKITDDYTVPGDVCESYEAVYEMLSQLDESYK